jgi:hypothetical protein
MWRVPDGHLALNMCPRRRPDDVSLPLRTRGACTAAGVFACVCLFHICVFFTFASFTFVVCLRMLAYACGLVCVLLLAPDLFAVGPPLTMILQIDLGYCVVSCVCFASVSARRVFLLLFVCMPGRSQALPRCAPASSYQKKP